MIDAATAKKLATIYARRFGPYGRQMLETGYQGVIDFASLRPGVTAYFAESPYGEISSGFATPAAKGVGPFFLVSLYQGDVPAVAVAVSAYATDLIIQGDSIIPPKVYGNEFQWIGVRAGHEFPMAPESAIPIVRTRTGADVSAAPILITPKVDSWSALYSRWRMHLNRPVTMRTIGSPSSTVTTSVIYVDHAGELLVPTRADDMADAHPLPLASDIGRAAMSTLPSRNGASRNLVKAVMSSPGGYND